MKILTIHSDFIEIEPKTKAIKDAEEIKKQKERIEECLVVFTAVEEGDKENIVEKTVKEIEDVANQVKAEKIVLYPFVHLTSKPSSPSTALDILKKIESGLKKKYDVFRAPFGWYKKFIISCKGHPLSELSREIKEISQEEKRKPMKKTYKILTEKGELIKPEEYRFKKGEEDFKILVEKEALGKEAPGGEEPEYIKYCKRFGIDWEPMSDLGHMHFNPIGNFLFEMIADYSLNLAKSLEIPVYSMRGTQLFNLNERPVKEHAELFGDRLYEMQIDNKRFVMRYAACHQQFAIIKKWNISYRNMPFGAFEVADSYRFEQSGELLLCFRTRKMHMPDFHIFCKDVNEAEDWFFELHKKIYEEANKLGRDYVSLYNLTSKDFFEKNKDWFLKLVKSEKKPVLLCFYPSGINYYWILNIEYHIVDNMKRPREIGTVQIDVGNAERFGIRFMDKDNTHKYPAILHTAIFGTIERYLYMLFDSALQNKNPVLPLWLSPTQVRLCPVNDSFIKYCEKIADELEKNQIRADIDDRTESIEKKIRDSEVEWIPFAVVVGEKEKESGKLAVRFRETGKVEQMKQEKLVELIKEKTKDFPFRPLPVPKSLSKRPIFVG